MPRRSRIAAAVAAAVIAGGICLCAAARAPVPAAASPPTADELIVEAFRAAFNLDFDEAAAIARRAVVLQPEESRTHRTLASVLWQHMLFIRGSMTVDTYMGSVTKSEKSLPKIPAQIDVEFQVELRRAVDLAEARLKQQPKDLDAQHDVGAVSALQASYAASVQGSLMSAYGPAKRAFQMEDDVLSKDPKWMSAAFVVGIYRYVVSTFSMPTRIFAYIAGFGGGKDKGIGLLEMAASGGESRVEASAALMLIYTKEGRHKDAMQVAHRLAGEYPRNRIFVLEEGSAAARAGLGAEADAALTRGQALLKKDPRPRFPGEEALWTYKHAIAYTELGHLADAEASLKAALLAGPLDWVKGRIHLQMGRVADLNGQRPNAVAEYKQAKSICETQNDPICAEEASRLTKNAYTGK